MKTRLYVTPLLAEGAHIAATEAQAHLLLNVLRARAGDAVALFNGREGEWAAEVVATGKKSLAFQVGQRLRTQAHSPDVWLAFAPVKNEKIDYTVRRATELGASALLPVFTERTVVARVNEERLHANAVEAAEQSGRMDVPALHAPQKLENLLAAWPADRPLIFCDESGAGEPVRAFMPTLASAPRCAVLIGPEGGFSPEEAAMLRRLPFVKSLSLGSRILRAETAALAALAHVTAWMGGA